MIGGELAGQTGPHYSPAQGGMPEYVSIPNIQQYQKYKEEIGKDTANAAKNNYGNFALNQDEIKKNLIDYYRNTLEHEATHIPDKNITFAKKPKRDFIEPKPDLGMGYMANENHLAVGLGKIQREYYSLTGKRIESPDEFKQFLSSIANSGQSVEDSISQFSEEARRSLRPQIENMKNIKKYYDELNSINSNFFDRIFKIKPEPPVWRLDFLEKSAQLIPALVDVGGESKNKTT